MTRDDIIDRITEKVLDNKGFNYATDPMEYGQNAYDITLYTREEVEFILKTADELKNTVSHHQV